VATHDYVIANGTGAAVRSDINGALAAIVSNNSSATEPATMYAYQWWPDTTTGLLKIRNSANSAWVTIGTLASTNLGLLPVAGGTMTGVLAVTAGTAALPGIAVSGDLNTGIYSPGADTLAITTSGTGRVFVDSSGRLLVGTSTARGNVYVGAVATTPQTQLELNANAYSGLSLLSYSASGYEPILNLGISLSNTAGTNTAVVNNSTLATVNFTGNDGTNFRSAAWIQAQVDGTPGANDMPGRLVFSTTADGASSPTERMRINNAGNVTIGSDGTTTLYNQTSITGAVIERSGAIQLARSSDTLLLINRISNDGDLVNFYQNGTSEGTISVSGTTVSYNGAHLSRWSQLPDGTERTKILRGTVLSNIDEMCGWGDEDNEQLNRMKVSDVEGDKNVSGVFQCWDDDDDTYTDDFYCAMTGDFIIRIAEGVTVQRGDLLMSAGNGTAKPQDDDIIRSKTVAKVTSTHVACTYEDGSYCVPCVLMAC
jgi:hypothetical protein